VGKRRAFKAQREPEYWVMTKWEPEDIDGISLKFRDLSVTYGIMLDYTKGFVEAVEREHVREGARLDMNAPISDNTRRYQDLVRIVFSAHLAAYASILYYLHETMDAAGRAWLSALRDDDPALASFDRLRNRDVHHEPMHTLLGMRFRITGSQPPYSSIDTKEVHMHQMLLHEGVGFYPPPVAETKQFAGHPGLVQFITFESVLQLAHRVIHKIATLLNEAVEGGHWIGTGILFSCDLCRGASDPESGAGEN
jgi:hypothetical protein